VQTAMLFNVHSRPPDIGRHSTSFAVERFSLFFYWTNVGLYHRFGRRHNLNLIRHILPLFSKFLRREDKKCEKFGLNFWPQPPLTARVSK